MENHQEYPKALCQIKPILSDQQVIWRCQSLSDIAYISKFQPKMLAKVQLTNIMSSRIRNTGIRKLRKALIDNKRVSFLSFKKTPECRKLHHLLNLNNNLKILNISYDHAEHNIFKKEAIKKLLRLKRCRNLSSLGMNFSCSKFNKDRILQEISKHLRVLPKLRTLKINIRDSDLFDWRLELARTIHHTYDPNIYLLQLQLPRALSSLDLTFGRGIFTKQDLLIFASHVQKLTFLEHLALNFGLDKNFQNIGLDESRTFSLLFKKTQNLKTLTITNPINLCSELKGTRIFLENFQHLKNLTNLSLDFSLYCAGNSNSVLPEMLFSSLALVPSFKSLKLHLSDDNSYQSKQIKNVLAQIQCFTHLEKLYLNLTECAFNPVFKNVVQIIHCLTKLNSLEILLSAKDIDCEKVILLVQNLKRLTKLKTLSLHLREFHPNYELIEILSNRVSQLNLTSFQLILDPKGQPKPIFQRLASFWKSKKELTPLFSTLAGFKELTALNLDLQTFEISEKEAREFSGALKELKQLSSLMLELPQFSSENSLEGFQIIVSSLKEIRNLNSFVLSFGRNSISKEEIRCLELGIGECRSLEFLNLNLQHTEKLTLEDVRCLILGLRCLILLKSFQLELGNMEMTNAEVVKLVESMTVLESLEHLRLNISFARMVVLDLNKVKNFENLRHLRKFELNYQILF